MKRILPAEEIAVARRLAEFRKEWGIPRALLALRFGMTTDQMANYELSRVPVPAVLGLKLLREYGLSPLWLAFGEEPQHIPQGLASDLPTATDNPGRLTSYCRDVIAPFLRSPEGVRRLTFHGVNEVLDVIQGGLSCEGFDEEQRAEIATAMARLERALFGTEDIPQLDTFSSKSIISAVQNRFGSIDSVLSYVRDATKQRGAKAALALRLNITRQQLSDWLGESKKPSANHAIALHSWALEHRAASQNKPAPVVRKPRRKAQDRKDDNEKSTSDPPTK